MRPNNNQQNNKNRSRGRNGGRKHSNPLSRNFESNGPDVKVRGNASHIAEKYVQLARDAQSSGDSVMAENYFQHAEHYFRILNAAQPPQSQQRNDNGNTDSDDNDADDNTDDNSNNGDGVKRADAAEVVAKAPVPNDKPEGEGEAEEKPRARRPRRRKVTEKTEDAASADQPDVGELPAFLTAGTVNAAE